MIIEWVLKKTAHTTYICTKKDNATGDLSTMQKLKYQVLEKLMKLHKDPGKRPTNAELDFLIFISRYQDEAGRITGIYYKDICEKLNLSIQTFYNIIRSLETKGIVRLAKVDYTDWDILILDNDFRDKNYSDGYMKMNQKIFRNETFKKLKAGEKLLAMHFFKICASGDRTYHISKERFYKDYKNNFGFEKRTLKKYLTSLRELFSIGIKDGQYWITPLRWKVYNKKEERVETDNELLTEQISSTIKRRKKIVDMDVPGVKNIYRKYAKLFADAGYDPIDSFFKTVEKVLEQSATKKNKGRSLNVKFLQSKYRELADNLGIFVVGTEYI